MAVGGGEIEQRYGILFGRCYRPVLTYALRRTVNSVSAEDVVAETFLVAWRRIGDVPENPEAALLWLFGVARRVLANTRRGDARRDRLIARMHQHLGETVTPTVEDVAERTEQQWQVLAVLSRLGRADVEVLQLALWEQLTHAQIAVVLDCSVNAVAIRLHRARRAFAIQLGKYDEGTGHSSNVAPSAQELHSDGDD